MSASTYRALLLVGASLAISPSAFGGLIGITSGSGIGVEPEVYDIDPATGAASLIGRINDGFVPGTGFLFDDTFSLARDSSGMLFSVGRAFTGLAGVEPMVIEIDPSTGRGTFVTKLNASVFTSVNHIKAIAFSPADVLFAIAPGTTPSGASSDALYTIDLTTGTETLIGFTGISRLDALAFAPDGTLYGWQNPFTFYSLTTPGLGLVTIDPSTASVTDVNPLLDASHTVRSIAFDGFGQLFGAGEELVTIDRSTGTATSVGSIGVVIEGLESTHVSSVIPEPASLLLFSVGCGLLLICALRRHGKEGTEVCDTVRH